jgi:hypothetical protein
LLELGGAMRKVVWLLGLVLGVFLIVRAVAEPFAIDFNDPTTYQNDWGGPSLAGVLAVHIGPGLLALILIITAIVRRRARRNGEPLHPSRPHHG